MKKVIFIFAIILTALTSCEKEEIIVSETSKPQNKEILTFATQEEFEETLAKVNAMSKEERLAWEKEQGFKSFGTICDEFYETIDFENCKTIDDVKKHDPENKFLKIYFSGGEFYVEPAEMSIKEKFLANAEKMFIISDKAYKIIDSKTVFTNISNIESLKKAKRLKEFESINSYSIDLSQKISAAATAEQSYFEVTRADHNYKTKLRIQTENFWDVFPDHTDREVEFEITNYKNGWFGFYVYKLETYINIELASLDYKSMKSFVLTSYEPSYTVGNYTRDERTYICDGWTNAYDPFFEMRKIDVSTTAGTIYINDLLN